jgi:hypothetical protein
MAFVAIRRGGVAGKRTEAVRGGALRVESS